MTTTARSLGRPMSPAWALLIVLALLVAITAVGIGTGAIRIPAPAPVNGPIVFGRYVDAVGDTAVMIARPDGTGERVVVPAPAECPQISPDGAKVALAFGVVNIDGTNEGFNDPTPVAPVGGNSGTTRGQQRLNVFQHAAQIWGAILPSAVEIRVEAGYKGGRVTYEPDGTELDVVLP